MGLVYELFVHPAHGARLWDRLMQAGKPFGLLPLGMQALDRARMEAGLLTLGYEFDDLTSPYQAGIGWTVAMKKPDFMGKAAPAQMQGIPLLIWQHPQQGQPVIEIHLASKDCGSLWTN